MNNTIEENQSDKKEKDQDKKLFKSIQILKKVVKSKNANDLTDIVYSFHFFTTLFKSCSRIFVLF